MSDIDDFWNLRSQVFAEYLKFILVFSLEIDYEFRSIFRSYLKCYRFKLAKSFLDTIRIVRTYKYGASCDNQLGILMVSVCRLEGATTTGPDSSLQEKQVLKFDRKSGIDVMNHHHVSHIFGVSDSFHFYGANFEFGLF